MVIDDVVEQPLASFTVRVYVPTAREDMELVVAPVDHE